MTNQQLIDKGNRMMDETDEAIERSKKVSLSLEDQISAFFLFDFNRDRLAMNKTVSLLAVEIK